MKRLLLGTTFVALLITTSASAQEYIITTSGKVIKTKEVKNIGRNEIKYKKNIFSIKSSKIKAKKVLYVETESGKRTYVNDITMAKNYQAFGTMPDKSISSGTFQPHFIERIGDRFRIDTAQIVKYKELNNLLEQSPDTVTLVMLKGAKLLRTFSNISDILAAPASASGGFASVKTVDKFIDMKKAGELSPKNYINMGLSFLATSALPIASGVMESIKKKLYNKTIKSYSAPKKSK